MRQLISIYQHGYVKDDTFVPVKKVAKDNSDLKEKLLQISGIQINDVDGRVYTLGQEAAHLIGYVQSINAEELQKYQDKGYTSTSIIGKSGLELAYEDRLKSTDGIQIYIADEKGNLVTEIAKQEQKDGEDVKITINSDIQKNLYTQLKDDKGLFVVMEPKTGELLALVSTPSYDSNDFSLGMTNAKWEELNNDASKPLYNRFLQSYCPGSTFKPITGAIGLTTGAFTKDDTFNYNGTSWQKDSSWGDYKVTTLTAYNGQKNLLNGLIHSDNIYFAQAALKIGTSNFTSNLEKIGFNESLDFPITLAKSKYSNSNTIESEGQLADSGFGQGNILVNPIHMASIYSSFANDGYMIKPYIEYKEDTKSEILKENVFTKDAANTIKEDLIQVVENPQGTANDMKVSGVTIAGKTGVGKTTIAKELQQVFGNNTMLISQDVIRRDMLKVKDGENTKALPLLEELLRYGRKHSEIVILEGILNAEWYRALFELAVALYGKNIYAYYFDIPFEETVKRHKTKPNCNDFSAEDMQRWWNEKDYISVLHETRITAEQDRESIVCDICQTIISNGK